MNLMGSFETEVTIVEYYRAHTSVPLKKKSKLKLDWCKVFRTEIQANLHAWTKKNAKTASI